MKRFFTILLFVMSLLYVWEGYNTYQAAMYAPETITGVLSDIAEEVTAIPLESAGNEPIKMAGMIRENNNSLFLVSNETLYHYTRDGQFVCQVTRPEEILVAGYLVDSADQELIVLGNEDDVFYYTYNGELKDRKKLENESSDRRILSIAMQGDRILAMEENSYLDVDTGEMYLSKELITYTTSFEKINSRRITSVDMGRFAFMEASLEPRICADPDTGCLYVYSPTMETDYLLEDTLHLRRNWTNLLVKAQKRNVIPVLPVYNSGRFLFSSSHDPMDNSMNYTFCYDKHNYQYKQLPKGWKDDYYKTGMIGRMEALDLYNRSYAFCQSGKAAKKAFPDRKDAENAVVFIVRMKEV